MKSIIQPHRFSILKWESQAIPSEARQWVSGENSGAADDVRAVYEFFSLLEKINSLKLCMNSIDAGKVVADKAAIGEEIGIFEAKTEEFKESAEGAIAAQIIGVLAEQGIYNPFCVRQFHLPPVSLRLEMPPHLLVVSPRDRIESISEITLNQDISIAQEEDIEGQVDNLGVSSLVVELGGFGGTFPTFVLSTAGPRFAIITAVEEYLHQYLAFTPLGFRYLLDVTGIARDYEIATINETVAGTVSKEIGAIVYNKFYPDDVSEIGEEQGLDFNAEMRQIRRTVDRLLAMGEIEQAEQFMEQKRLYLVSNGYYIRKLNQAYFAFYGMYGDSPISVSPIGLEVAELRSQYGSIKEFLDAASRLTSRQDLQSLLQ
ncbi:hypothetical protein ACFLXC_06360 [Chloroflexota bacterium]